VSDGQLTESNTWVLCMVFDLGRTDHRFEREGREVIERDWFTQMAAETVKALVCSCAHVCESVSRDGAMFQ
jgi:hypothetical protein